eukprot:628039-Rhodomonas_salina.1
MSDLGVAMPHQDMFLARTYLNVDKNDLLDADCAASEGERGLLAGHLERKLQRTLSGGVQQSRSKWKRREAKKT